MSTWVNSNLSTDNHYIHSVIIQLLNCNLCFFFFSFPQQLQRSMKSMDLHYSYFHQKPKYKVYEEATREGDETTGTQQEALPT